MVTGASELRAWGDVREDVEDNLVWEVKNCKNGVKWINT